MLKISRRSWHYRLLAYKDKTVFGYEFYDAPANLCKYFWAVVGSFIALAVYGISLPLGWMFGFREKKWESVRGYRELVYPRQAIYTAVVLWALYTLYAITSDNNWSKVGFEVGFIVSLVIGVGYFLIEVLPEWLRNGADKVEGLSFTQVAKEFVKAKKNRICPQVEVVE